MSISDFDEINIKWDTFYTMWKALEGNSIRQSIIRNLKSRQVRELKNRNALIGDELMVAKVWFPKLFKVTELTDKEIMHAAMYSDENKIRFVRRQDLTPEYVDAWINAHHLSALNMPALKFVMKSDAFTDAQKVAVLYMHDQFPFGEEDEKKHVKELKEIFASHTSHPKEMELALGTLLWYSTPSDDELKEIVIRAFDLAYKQHSGDKQPKMLFNLCQLFNTLTYRGVLNDLHEFIRDISLDSKNKDIFDPNYRNEQIANQMIESINKGMYTMDEIRKCHLDHLLANSKMILSTL